MIAAGEQELTWLSAGQSQVLVACCVWTVNSNRTDLPRLALADRRTIERIPIWRHVIDADGDNVAAAQLAVDRQVEQREIPLAPPSAVWF